MINNKTISVIIPAYNEGEVIKRTLEALNHNWIDEIIVVNDGSQDNTLNVVSKYPVKIIDLLKNQGKGNAVLKGLKASTGDIILMVDADLGESIKEVKKLVLPLVKEQVEATIAVLPIKGGGLGVVRKLADFGMKYMTGRKMIAPLSGQRAFKREVIDKLLPLQNGFGLEMGINVALIEKQISFSEIECDFQHRVTGHNYIGYRHRFKQFIDIIKSIWLLKKGKYV